jgi:hypothetical protein
MTAAAPAITYWEIRWPSLALVFSLGVKLVGLWEGVELVGWTSLQNVRHARSRTKSWPVRHWRGKPLESSGARWWQQTSLPNTAALRRAGAVARPFFLAVHLGNVRTPLVILEPPVWIGPLQAWFQMIRAPSYLMDFMRVSVPLVGWHYIQRGVSVGLWSIHSCLRAFLNAHLGNDSGPRDVLFVLLFCVKERHSQRESQSPHVLIPIS